MTEAQRPTLRESPKELSPLERAKKRTADILSNVGDLDDGNDEFRIDLDIVPDGWTYEWKSYMIYGKVDPAYQVSLARKGWEAVPSSRHPELMPGGTDEAFITRKGMILMERPSEITESIRSLEYKRAKDQVRSKEQQLSAAPQGQFDRSNKQDSLVKIKKGFEAMPIPE